jgi:hypothetical protein
MEECVAPQKLYSVSVGEPAPDGEDGETMDWVVMDAEHFIKVFEPLELADFPYDCQALADFHIFVLPPPPCIISMGSKHV